MWRKDLKKIWSSDVVFNFLQRAFENVIFAVVSFCVFSGADLGALLSEAHLMAVHDILNSRKLDKVNLNSEVSLSYSSNVVDQIEPKGAPKVHSSSAEAVEVTSAHLMQALACARPSIPAAERNRLESIYSRFGKARGNSADADGGHGIKRATLA